jgi:bifunctional non-homologous end joining protein LigD
MNADAPKKAAPKSASLVQTYAPGTWTMEPKYDGIRVLAHVKDGEVDFFTRTGNKQNGKLPHVEAELLAAFPANTWLDGEVVQFGENGTQVWGGAQSCIGSSVAKAAIASVNCTYVVFDCMAYDGLDIRPLPLEGRRQVLDTHLSEEGEYIMASPQFDPQDTLYDMWLERGYEGAMVKRLDSAYSSGVRSKNWIKLKANDLADVVVMGYKPGESSFAGMIGAVEFGQYDDQGNLVNRGRCSGMDMATRRDITANQTEYIGRVFSCSYMTIMPSGALRHPQFKKWRDDKPAEDCQWT